VLEQNCYSTERKDTHLTASLGKLAPERLNQSDFNKARDDGVVVASAGPCANQLHLVPDRQPRQYLVTQFFTDQILFPTPNQQSESTKGKLL